MLPCVLMAHRSLHVATVTVYFHLYLQDGLSVWRTNLVWCVDATITATCVSELRQGATRTSFLPESMWVTSTIMMTSFGAFIDLGGVDGLVHVTELSHERNVSPKSVVSVGDEVEVKVLAIDEEAGRVSLSLKATTPGPWDGVEQKLARCV